MLPLAKAAEADRAAQARAFEAFRREYNEERPHEALGMDRGTCRMRCGSWEAHPPSSAATPYRPPTRTSTPTPSAISPATMKRCATLWHDADAQQ
nr:hypothetical protein [Mesorhizobium sp.]